MATMAAIGVARPDHVWQIRPDRATSVMVVPRDLAGGRIGDQRKALSKYQVDLSATPRRNS
jgi:hypothetical protein